MATTYTWSIANLERDASTGGISIAHYRVDAVDGDYAAGYTAGAYGSIGLTVDADASNFVAYESVTEAQVIGWVQAKLGGADKVTEIEVALQAKIDENKAPSTLTGMPWAD